MFSTTDTIVAIATPPGRGGIGVVRLSGPSAHAIVKQLISRDEDLAPRHATLASIATIERERRGDAFDHVIATHFPAPASYTGDAVVELSAHGSPVVLQAIVAGAIQAGARLAAPGEFTLRAFLNGRVDLTQAEAVADLIDAATPAQARAAFDQLNGTLTNAIGDIDRELFDLVARLEASIDFPEEGYHFVEPGELASAIEQIADRVRKLIASGRRGRLLREGLHIAIIGAPNVGKSSLFNALVGSSRAIVTEIPGTTRDLVTEAIDLAGLRVTLIDTAGLRESADPVEREGVLRSRGASSVADLVLLVADQSVPREESEVEGLVADERVLGVASKGDLTPAWHDERFVRVSSTTGSGLETLVRRIVEALDVEPMIDRPAITNVRHITLLESAHASLVRAREAALDASGRSMSEEFVLADLQTAREALEEITGRRTSDDVLAYIFSRFCIGK